MERGPTKSFALRSAHFNRALELDPRNVHALGGLADTAYLKGVRGLLNREAAFAEGDALRERALAIAPDFAELQASLGFMYLFYKDDFDSAGKHLARAVELDPSFVTGQRQYGAWRKIAGRLPEALEAMRNAVRMAPSAAFMHVGEADVLMGIGRYDEAIDPLRKALRLAPGYESALERLVLSAHRVGRHEDALDANRGLLGIRGQHERLAAYDAGIANLGYASARIADLRHEVEERINGSQPVFEEKGSRQPADCITIALMELNEWPRAMDWVERSYHSRPGRLRRVLMDMPFDRRGLAVDSRYVRLLRSAGLEELL